MRKHYEVMEVDAWRDAGSWNYNSLDKLGNLSLDDDRLDGSRSARSVAIYLLKELRKSRFLSYKSAGNVYVEEVGDWGYEVGAKANRQPLLYLRLMEER